jgi:Tfp pilus assembly protein PilN
MMVVGIAAGVVVFVVLMAYYASLFAKSKSLAKELVVAQAELQKYEAIDAQVKSYQAQESSLSSRFSVIQQLLKGTLTYPKFFEDFMSLLPGDIWLTRLTTTTDASYGLTVSADAKALSSFAIADWLTNLLQAKNLYSNVRLGEIRVEEQNEGNSAVYSFTMSFTYRRTDN